MNSKPKLGLALGGGVAWGLAHIGVLCVLEKEGIQVDLIAGTSAGAAIGALYARLRSADYLKTLVMNMNWREWAHLVDPSLPKSGLIKGKRLMDFVKSHMGGNVDFADLQVPFCCIATDILNGDEIILDKGPVLDAVRASISIPAVFMVHKVKNRYLVDGGLVNQVPVSAVKKMGADVIIAVNVIPDMNDPEHLPEIDTTLKPKEPSLFYSIVHAIYIATEAIVKISLQQADIAIVPHLQHIGIAEFHRAADIIYLGELAARDALPAIKAKLATPIS